MADFVPFFQTALWVGLIACVLFFWRKLWAGILGGLRDRIERGDHVKLGFLSLQAELELASEGVPRVNPDSPGPPAAANSSAQELEGLRRQIGLDQRSVYLVHVATPSTKRGQTHELFVYLAGWKRDRFGLPNDLSDVRSAEFHIGPKFTPAGVTVVRQAGETIGFATSAYGPVLCVCRVTFEDGHHAVLQRYLDFESAELAQRAWAASA